MHIYDPRPDATKRQLAAMGQNIAAKPSILDDGETALSKGLNEFQKGWLLQYCVDRFTTLHNSLSGWRAKMEKWERMADDDYSDRKQRPDPETTNAQRTIFEKQNHTLGVISGFADFLYAQARDDIFGTRPWLAATPVGQNDNNLAERVTKHSQWKFDQSNLEATLLDTIRMAIDLGTQFVKIRWVRDVEKFETVQVVACSVKSGEPILHPLTGDYLQSVEDLETAGIVAGDVEWRERLVEETQMVYNNLVADNLDFKDVAFEAKAPELDLQYTDFFTRARIGLLDAVSLYRLDEQQRMALRASYTGDHDGNRDHRDEESPGGTNAIVTATGLDANPQVTLVDGFVRVDPFQKGEPKRLHVVFIPEVSVLLYCEYLANDSPDGILPVFPVRCFKTPNRILGRGYFERFEDAGTAIDSHYNSVTYHNRQQSIPFKGVHRDALVNALEGETITLDPDKAYELAPEKKLSDFVEFATIPDANGRSVELMNQMLQLAQMRTGITSAAQGELKGVPNANTATGVRQLTSRGAVLTKWPIDQQMTDIERAVQYCVHLSYANQDYDETFMWGEGKDAELMEIKSGDVKGMRANVSLTLTQSQNQSKLENAMAAANLASQYAQLPETEKTGQRRLYVQAVGALGFNDADKIIREAMASPEAIMAMLPPDLQPVFMAFLQQNGLVAPEGVEAAAGAETPASGTEPVEISHAPVPAGAPTM